MSDFNCKVWRFKPDTGKYYDEIEFVFNNPDFNEAIEEIRKHQADPKLNPSGFAFVVTGEGNIRNLHPKLISKGAVPTYLLK